MGLRYRRRIRIAPGVYLNLSKSGMSVTLGGGKTLRGSINVSMRGIRPVVSAPGTGAGWYGKTIPWSKVGEWLAGKKASPAHKDRLGKETVATAREAAHRGSKSLAGRTSRGPDKSLLDDDANSLGAADESQFIGIAGAFPQTSPAKRARDALLLVGKSLGDLGYELTDETTFFPIELGAPLTCGAYPLASGDIRLDSANGAPARWRSRLGHPAQSLDRRTAFASLIRHRRHARDFEKLPASSEALIQIAMIRLMSKRLAKARN